VSEKKIPVIGFIGLGVMGKPMCRNIALKHGADVIAFDVNPAAFTALSGTRARQAQTLSEVAEQADIVFLSLPGGQQVEHVCLGPQGLASASNPPSLIVDLSTTTVAVARSVADRLGSKGIAFADAPVARTREAAQRGELSIMVGAEEALYARIEPLLRYMGSDVTRCGGIGCGQVVKLINNALLFENTMAIAEMMVVSERAGVAPSVLLDAISKGSGDSFALRNHARKAMLPRQFPEQSFSPEYVLKDIEYVLELADHMGVSAHATQLAQRYYTATANNGWSGRYFPAVIEIVDQNIDLPEQFGEGSKSP
jgi:3-hydroxyisobutyrate dehydrogenase-like beta-hydroxyacid dehydrogenase